MGREVALLESTPPISLVSSPDCPARQDDRRLQQSGIAHHRRGRRQRNPNEKTNEMLPSRQESEQSDSGMFFLKAELGVCCCRVPRTSDEALFFPCFNLFMLMGTTIYAYVAEFTTLSPLTLSFDYANVLVPSHYFSLAVDHTNRLVRYYTSCLAFL